MIQVEETEFGTEPHKLHRRESSDTSRESAHSVDTSHLEQVVFEFIESAGAYGATQEDLLEAFPHMPYSSITARPSALLRKRLIVDSGERRRGASGRTQRVLKAAKYAD